MEPSESTTADALAPAELRFRAVVRALLAPSQGGLLLHMQPGLAQLLVGQGMVVWVALDQSPSEDALCTQLEDLTAENGAKQRVVLVSDRPWAQAALKRVRERAPSGLALYHVAPDGEVWSQTSLLVSDLRVGLKSQATATIAADEPREAFLAELDQVLRSTAEQVGDVQSFAKALNARPVRVTYALLGLYAGMFALSYAFGGPERIGVLARMGAEVPERIRDGEWWRLLSATVLHGGVIHLLMNSLVLWNLGTFMERLLGWGRFLTVYVLSGLFGSALGTLLAPLLKFGVSVGASGALFGLLGASAALAFRPAGLPELMVRDLKKSTTQNLVLNVLVSLRPHVDWAAHLGGAICGGALTLLGIVRPQPLGTEAGEPAGTGGARPADRAFATSGALLGLLLLACTALALVKGQPWLLRDLSIVTRAPIGKTGLSIESPAALGEPKPVERSDGVAELSLGGADSGQWVSLLVSPLTEPLVTPEQRQAAWAQNLDELKAFRPKEQATPVGEPELTQLGGYPVLDVHFTLNNGVDYQRLTTLRSRYFIILELVSPPRFAESQRVDGRRMLASVREEP